MSIISTLRRILNDTPGTATNIDYNFQVLEDYINGSVVTIDGLNAMTGTLTLAGPPTDPLHAASKGYVDSLWFPGMTVDYGGDTAPAGWELCDGGTHSSTDPKYAALFQVIGYRFGDAGGGNFKMPAAGRFVLSADATHAIGTGGGSADSQLLQHAHSVPVHGHAMSGSTGNDNEQHGHTFSGSVTGSGGHTHTSNGGHSEFVFRDSDYFTHYAAPSIDPPGYGAGGLALTWGPIGLPGNDGSHTHGLTGTVGNITGNHTHARGSLAVTDKPAFDTTNAGAGTTLTGMNMPPYVVMNRIMKL